MNEGLENLKEIVSRQNNGNGDLYLEATIIKPIEKDIDKLHRIGKLINLSYAEKKLLKIEFDMWCKKNRADKNDKVNLITWLLRIKLKEVLENE